MLKIGDIVQYKKQEAKITEIDRRGHPRILIKETGEYRYVRIKDLK